MTDVEGLYQPTVDAALESLAHGDSLEAIAILTSAGEPRRATKCFQLTVRELFTQRLLPQMIWIGRSGLEYALREAHSAANSEVRSELVSAARKLSYNISANLWPGWGDEAVQPTSSDLLAALDLARVHLRLVRGADHDAEMLGNAHWLVGAQRLGNSQEQSAHHEFDTAKAVYQQAGHSTCEWMAEGYVALSLQLMGSMGTEGLHRFQAAQDQLRQLGDDGDFFADQLKTAQQFFLAR